MDRRRFIGTLAGSLLVATLAAEAQQAGKVPRIGWVGNMAPPPPPVSQLDGFRQGLRELGYVEGQNLVTVGRLASLTGFLISSLISFASRWTCCWWQVSKVSMPRNGQEAERPPCWSHVIRWKPL